MSPVHRLFLAAAHVSFARHATRVAAMPEGVFRRHMQLLPENRQFPHINKSHRRQGLWWRPAVLPHVSQLCDLARGRRGIGTGGESHPPCVLRLEPNKLQFEFDKGLGML